MIAWSPLKKFRSQSVFVLAAISFLAAQLPAQERSFRSTTFYKVHPGRVGDFQAAVKEYNAVLTKAGYDKPYTLWLSQTGDREYALVSNHAKLAELDMVRTDDPKLKNQQTDLVRIAGRINACTEESRRYLGEIEGSLSLPVPKEPFKMVSVLRTEVKPDRVPEYVALVKSELVPAIKKSGAKFYTVTRTRYGGPASEFVSVRAIDGWADLDGPSAAEKGMGADGYQKYLGKVRPLIVKAEYNVFRYLPDLSFRPDLPEGSAGAGR